VLAGEIRLLDRLGHSLDRGQRRPEMHVRDLMSRSVVTVGASDSCQAAVRRMYEHKIRHLPVVESDGRLVGIVTDRDLRHHLFAPGIFPKVGEVAVRTILEAVPVSAVMSTPVICVQPGDPLETAAAHMLEDKVGSLPVVENGRPVGIITETDLLRQIVRTDARYPEVDTIVISYP
jgi:acetoin utilization protein AcuB